MSINSSFRCKLNVKGTTFTAKLSRTMDTGSIAVEFESCPRRKKQKKLAGLSPRATDADVRCSARSYSKSKIRRFQCQKKGRPFGSHSQGFAYSTTN